MKAIIPAHKNNNNTFFFTFTFYETYLTIQENICLSKMYLTEKESKVTLNSSTRFSNNG